MATSFLLHSMAPRNWWPDRSSNKLTTWARSVAASNEHGWNLRLLTDGFIPNYKCPHLHEISCIGRWLATGNWKRRCYLLTYLLTERRVPSICLVDWQSCWLTEMLHQNRIRSWCSAWISLPGILYRSTLQAKPPALTEDWQHEILVRESEMFSPPNHYSRFYPHRIFSMFQF